MPFQVVTRDGETLTLDDGQLVPDGARLVLPVTLMDSVQRSVHDARREEEEQEDDGEHDDADPERRRAQAYLAMKTRLDTAAPARRQPKPQDPSWQRRVPWKPEGRYGNDGTPPDEPSAPHDAARKAYEARRQTNG
jgi:hypothetical protein